MDNTLSVGEVVNVKNATSTELINRYILHLRKKNPSISAEDMKGKVLPWISEMMDSGYCTQRHISDAEFLINHLYQHAKTEKELFKKEFTQGIVHSIIDGSSPSTESMLAECKQIQGTVATMENKLCQAYAEVIQTFTQKVLNRFESHLEKDYVELLRS